MTIMKDAMDSAAKDLKHLIFMEQGILMGSDETKSGIGVDTKHVPKSNLNQFIKEAVDHFQPDFIVLFARANAMKVDKVTHKPDRENKEDVMVLHGKHKSGEQLYYTIRLSKTESGDITWAEPEVGTVTYDKFLDGVFGDKQRLH